MAQVFRGNAMVGLSAALVSILIPLTAHAAPVCEAAPGSKCLYVDPVRGNDANPGSFTQPVFRPQIALWKARPGDVVYLRGGTYSSAHGYPAATVSLSDCSQGLVYALAVIGTIGLPGCVSAAAAGAPGRNWLVSSGTADKPITLTSYPGERAVAAYINGKTPASRDYSGGILVQRRSKLDPDIAFWSIRNLTIRGGAIEVSGGSRGDDGSPTGQAHDIQIVGNEISDFVVNKGNVGLIKIGRGRFGGPYNILIEDNKLHDIALDDCTSPSLCGDTTGAFLDWKTMGLQSAQLIGGITTLSCEGYELPLGECGGNGLLVIRNNTIFNVPAPLYFKNPAKGPTVVEGNTMYNGRVISALLSASNSMLRRNLFYDFTERRGMRPGVTGPDYIVHLLAGKNLHLSYNTFVGFDNVVELQSDGSFHTIRNNIVFGLQNQAAENRQDDTLRGYLARGKGEWGKYQDAADTAQSDLGNGNDFDDNCLISPHQNFRALSRLVPPSLDKVALEQLRNVLKLETHSVAIQESNPANVFAAPQSHDYRIKAGSPAASACAQMGAYAAPLAVTDTTPPNIVSGNSITVPAGTAEAEFTITTDEDAYCRYAQTPATHFDIMPRPFHRTGRTRHVGWINGLQNGTSNKIYARCIDLALNRSPEDFVVTIRVNNTLAPQAPSELFIGR